MKTSFAKQFAGDVLSPKAALYDFMAVTFFWMPYFAARTFAMDAPLPWESLVPFLYFFGLFAYVVMSGYMAVWTIRPLLFALAAGAFGIYVGHVVFVTGAIIAIALVLGIRLFNCRRNLAPHPSFQLDRERPRFYQE